MRDVAAIREMLQTTDPLRLVAGGCEAATASSHTTTTQVIGSRFHFCDPNSPAENDSGMIFSPLEPIAVDVITAVNGDEEMVQGMLPGHGVAWVHREDIVSEESRESVDQVPSVPATIELYGVNLKSGEATLALLRVINRGLSRLEFTVTPDIDIDECFCEVTATCMDLKELRLNGARVKNLEVISDAYRIDTFCLSRLEIGDPIVCDGGHVRRFFEALADPHHPIGSHLESLDIKVTADEAEKFDFHDAILDILGRNVRLLDLKIRFCLPRSRPIPKSYFNPIRDNHRNDMMAIPLDTKSKLAFLSVVATSANDNPEARRQLNSSVISIIFELSARAHKRNVRVEIVRASQLGR